MKGKKETHVHKVSWAQASRDVITRAMDKGLLLPLGIFLITIMVFYKLDNKQIEYIIIQFADGLKDHSLLGWLLSIILIISWAYHAKLMRKVFSSEADRIGLEKTRYQQNSTDYKLGTSNQQQRRNRERKK